VPKPQEDEDDDRPYSLAPKEPVGVSSAESCTTALTKEKRRAMKTYVNTLGPKLRETYGKRPHYEPEQVRTTVVASGMNIDYLCWAFVIYCAAPDFERIHAAAGEACDYTAMREVVGGAFFGGHADFVTSDVIDAIVSGTAADAVSGAGHLSGWLGDVDWSNLIDWS
jgi:hypothetical protein